MLFTPKCFLMYFLKTKNSFTYPQYSRSFNIDNYYYLIYSPYSNCPNNIIYNNIFTVQDPVQGCVLHQLSGHFSLLSCGMSPLPFFLFQNFDILQSYRHANYFVKCPSVWACLISPHHSL